MIPAALGNFIGGGLFVGGAYWYLYLTGEAGVKVRFDLGSEMTAVNGGAGPMRISGQDPNENGTNQILSPQPSHLMSGIGADLHDNSPYAKTWKEREMAASEENGSYSNGEEKV